MANILIVDDEDLILYSLRRLLEDEGHEVAAARDGATAHEVLRKSAFDLVITDILMPEKNGIDLIIDLQNEHIDVPVIAISGGDRTPTSAPIFLNMARELGAVHILRKPMNDIDFMEAVNSCLKH